MLGSGDAMVTLLAALLVVAAPSDVRTYAVDPATSTVAYHVVHPFHRVTGTSSRVEGKAVLFPDGKVIAMVRVPVASFDSGVANRDSNMRDAVEHGRFPFVVFKGVSSILTPVSYGRPAPTTLRGELDFHGVKRPIDVPVSVEFQKDGSAKVRGAMAVSLDAHRVERPSLLFIKVDDDCRIDGNHRRDGRDDSRSEGSGVPDESSAGRTRRSRDGTNRDAERGVGRREELRPEDGRRSFQEE